MKRFSLMLVLPLFIFAQNPAYKDRVVFKNHQKQQISVKLIVDDMLYYRFGANKQKAIGMGAVDSLFIQPLGLVYTADKGYLTDRSAIDAVLQSHPQKLDDLAVAAQKHGLMDRLSMAVLFVPYSQTIVGLYTYGRSTKFAPDYFTSSYSETKFDFQLAFALSNRLELIGAFSMNTSNDFSKDYYQYNTSDPEERENTSNNGTSSFGLGLRYYLSSPDVMHSRFFILAMGGVDLSHIKFESKQIQPKSDNTYTSNESDYLKDILSPYFITVGFGGEYALNGGLGLMGQVTFDYRSSKGDYKASSTDPVTLSTVHRELSSIQTRVALGINFHF